MNTNVTPGIAQFTTGSGVNGTFAAATLSFDSNPTDTQTIILDDGVNAALTFEFESGGGITGDVEVTIGGSAGATAANFATAVNAQTALNFFASVSGILVTITNLQTGVKGNTSITGTAIDASVTVVGATNAFTGGTDEIIGVIDTRTSKFPTGPYTMIGRFTNATDVDLTLTLEQSADRATWAGINVRAGGAGVASVTVGASSSVEFIHNGLAARQQYLRFAISSPDDTVGGGNLTLAHWLRGIDEVAA